MATDSITIADVSTDDDVEAVSVILDGRTRLA